MFLYPDSHFHSVPILMPPSPQNPKEKPASNYFPLPPHHQDVMVNYLMLFHGYNLMSNIKLAESTNYILFV